MAIKINVKPDGLTVAVGGELDHHNASVMRMEADEAIQSLRPKCVFIDFGEVTFMDSSGIGFVMGRYRLVSAYGGNVEVVNLSDRVFKMMKLAGLDKLVKLQKKTEKGI